MKTTTNNNPTIEQSITSIFSSLSAKHTDKVVVREKAAKGSASKGAISIFTPEQLLDNNNDKAADDTNDQLRESTDDQINEGVNDQPFNEAGDQTKEGTNDQPSDQDDDQSRNKPRSQRRAPVPILKYAFYPDILRPSQLGSIAIYGDYLAGIHLFVSQRRSIFGLKVASVNIKMGRRPFIDITLAA